MNRDYEMVIGLEVHVELATETKIFCGCKASFGGKPNTHICPVCMGLPGTLPVLNKKVLEYALRVGIATNCEINKISKFDRKNYFYPDNPQNYQISGLYLPLCHDGYIDVVLDDTITRVGIHEIHMEEDAGKLIHDENKPLSYVDYNRAGVPLIEIVTEPDMRNANEVISFLDKLRLIISYLSVSDCKLQEGSMRVDVNLSVRRKGDKQLGTRTEMKNLNSFSAISRAIENEAERQINLLIEGKEIYMETRRWDDNKGISYLMRSKEDAMDYRYFPEPDLMPICVTDEMLEDIRKSQPELRDQKMERFSQEYGLSKYDIELLTSDRHMANVFEETVREGAAPKTVANWLLGETNRILKERALDTDSITFAPKNLAKLIKLVSDGTINMTVAKEVFEKIAEIQSRKV